MNNCPPKPNSSQESPSLSERLLTGNRALFFIVLASALQPTVAPAQTEKTTPISAIEIVNEAGYRATLKRMNYRNIAQLDSSEIEWNMGILKEAIEVGSLTLDEVKERIFPPFAYASGIYFSHNFIQNVLPKRIREREGMSDVYTESLRKFVEEGKTAKEHQKKHEKVFAAYTKLFGESIDYNKVSTIFKRWESDNMPPKAEFESDHDDAIDVYYPMEKEVDGEHFGPEVLAYESGVVIAAENGWRGDKTKLSYQGGGLGGKTGNGVIIYNPEKNQYTYYAHFSKVDVSKGDIVQADQVIGCGGNTGIDARKPCCGRHVHFEIHNYNEGGEFVFVPKEELYFLLSGRSIVDR